LKFFNIFVLAFPKYKKNLYHNILKGGFKLTKIYLKTNYIQILFYKEQLYTYIQMISNFLY